jgi:protein-L-isoaspartate O-methyltransferase
MPTSSATQPGLVVQMLRLGCLRDGDAICDMGTGTGYSAALLCHRIGAGSVTSIDIDPYLTKAATERLGVLGHHPAVHTTDAAQALPGTFDAIVAMFSVRPCPPSWLAALLVVSLVPGTVEIDPDGTIRLAATSGRQCTV